MKELLLLEFLLSTPPDTVAPPVADEGEPETEEGVQKMRRMGTAMMIIMEMIRMKIAMRMNDYEKE